MIHVPERFIQTIMDVHGEKGQIWLKRFDELLAYCEQKWSLKIMSPYPLSYNFVAPVLCKDGSEAVLKLGVPSSELQSEIEALRFYQGNGVADLMEADVEKGILLMERVSPGHTLATVACDEAATRIAARVINKISRPAPGDSLFPTVAQWAEGLNKMRRHFNGGTGPLPEPMVRRAESYYGYWPGLTVTLSSRRGGASRTIAAVRRIGSRKHDC